MCCTFKAVGAVNSERNFSHCMQLSDQLLTQLTYSGKKLQQLVRKRIEKWLVCFEKSNHIVLELK
jgi:hypothetical protein